MKTDSNIVSVTVDTEVTPQFTRKYSFTEDTRMVVEVKGSREAEISLEIEVGSGCTFSGLLVNHSGSQLKLHDAFRLNADSSTSLAYCHLNSQPVVQQSNYELAGRGARLQSVSATLTNVRNTFDQQTVHTAPDSEAVISNYGLVMQSGYCDYVVKNRIGEKVTGCTSRQTSRLLNLDEESGGRILPILYIDNNDVKASHAASMGRPDENTLFYLQTRGLTPRQSLQLIAVGYLSAATENIGDEQISEMLKQEIEEKVAQCLM